MFTKSAEAIDIMLSENFIRTWGLGGKVVGVHVLEGGILLGYLKTVLVFHILHSGMPHVYNNIYDGRLLLQLLIQTSLQTRSGNILWR